MRLRIRSLRARPRGAVAGACLLAVACGPDEPDPATAVDLGAPGPFSVGTLDTTFVAPDGSERRLQAWYPSRDDVDAPVTYDGIWDGGAGEGLEPACEETLPTVLFSHGMGGVRWQSAFLTEHLASHGYVVIAPDHPGSTFLDFDFDALTETALRRPSDIAEAFDWLTGADEVEVARCIDASQGYAVSGHSFGGYTAFATSGAGVWVPDAPEAVSLGDDRVWGVVALAPWDVDGMLVPETMGEVFAPTLLLSGGRDRDTPWDLVEGLFGGLEISPRRLGQFPDGGHASFAPITCLIWPDEDGCGEDYLDEAVVFRLVNQSSVAFLEAVRPGGADIGGYPEDSPDLWWAETTP